MGAIQNSLDKVVGTAIGAGIAAKKAINNIDSDGKQMNSAQDLTLSAHAGQNLARLEDKKKAADEKALHDKEQGLLAKEQYHEAKSAMPRLEGESQAASESLNAANINLEAAMNKRYGGKGNTKAAIAEGQKKALSEKDAAQRAFDELADKIEAKKAMMSRAEAIMKRTNTWGGMR